MAACYYLSSPIQNSDTDRPIHWLDGNISLILGIFAGHKAALIQTDIHSTTLLSSLQYMPNVQVVIGLGVASGQRNVSDLGDVLVSTSVHGISFKGGKMQPSKELIIDTSLSVAGKVFASEVSHWSGFKCSKADRKSKVHTGSLISIPLDHQGADIDTLLKGDKNLIGKETEGHKIAHTLLYLKEKENRLVDFVMIMGVMDYGSRVKMRSWLLTASLAAVSYAQHKLLNTNSSVYGEFLNYSLISCNIEILHAGMTFL